MQESAEAGVAFLLMLLFLHHKSVYLALPKDTHGWKPQNQH